MILSVFNLKYPVRVKYVKKLKWDKAPCMGIYEWDSDKQIHIIKIDSSVKGDSHMNTLAHEYIHAWQYEMGLKLSHGRTFKFWAEYLREYGYTVSKFQ